MRLRRSLLAQAREHGYVPSWANTFLTPDEQHGAKVLRLEARIDRLERIIEVMANEGAA